MFLFLYYILFQTDIISSHHNKYNNFHSSSCYNLWNQEMIYLLRHFQENLIYLLDFIKDLAHWNRICCYIIHKQVDWCFQILIFIVQLIFQIKFNLFIHHLLKLSKFKFLNESALINQYFHFLSKNFYSYENDQLILT